MGTTWGIENSANPASVLALSASVLVACSSPAQSTSDAGQPQAFQSYWKCALTEVDQGTTTTFNGRMVETNEFAAGFEGAPNATVGIWDNGGIRTDGGDNPSHPSLSLSDWMCGGDFALSGQSAVAAGYTCSGSQLAVSSGTLSLSADGRTMHINLVGADGHSDADGGADAGAAQSASLSGTCNWTGTPP
jgi:hypothetical protein